MFNRSITSSIVTLSLFVAFAASGQHGNFRTKTVDPALNAADFQTIQAAINAIGATTDKWTVLVFAGVYTESVTLGVQDENIDIVGMDREAVIIKPSLSGNGITITSGAEAERNNRIANLTIETTSGHGIEIVKGTATPKNITIDGVTIRAAGTLMNGIEASAAETVRIDNCDITSAAGNAVNVGDDFEILNSDLAAPLTTSTRQALLTSGKDGLRVRGCTLTGGSRGMSIEGNPGSINIDVSDSFIQGGIEGLHLHRIANVRENIRFRNCHIVAENLDAETICMAVYGDGGSYDNDQLELIGCRIEAIGGDDSVTVVGYQSDNTNGTRLVDCDISATTSNSTTQARVYGVRCKGDSIGGDPMQVFIIGGSLESSQPNFAKAIDVFDLHGDNAGPDPDHIFVIGTRYSKWLGPINASGRPVNVTQTVNDIDIAADDAILTSQSLPLTETPVTPDNQPDIYRVLSVTGAGDFISEKIVYVEGTNWGGDRIIEQFTIVTADVEVKGKRPFRTVTSILLPAGTSGQSVEVGTTNILGLYYPLESATDVLQQARAADTTSAYTFESVGTVDVVYSTVLVNDPVPDGDSMQWLLVTAR